MSFGVDTPPMPAVPAAPPPPPMFGQKAPPRKSGQQNMQPSFLGTGAMPQAGQLGQHTLLGA